MIYMDPPFYTGNSLPPTPRVFVDNMSAHLTADTEAELIKYAISIGMKSIWLQYKGRYDFHFDITGKFLKICTDDPKVEKITAREMITRLELKREKYRYSKKLCDHPG